VETGDSSARLTSLLDALPEPSLIVRDGIVLMSNAAARAVLGSGIDRQDVRLAIRHPAAIERLRGPDSGSDPVELVGVGDIERRWVMTIAALDDGSKFVRLTDFSEAHAAEQMRVDFVANASHELRTPLATILGYAETLGEQGQEIDAHTRSRFTSIIHDEAKRMQRLVEDLISLSRIEAERFSPPTETIALLPLIEETLGNCTNLAEARSCTIVIDAPADLPPVVGDRSQLLQLLDNLVSNAIHYGRLGGTVRVCASAERNMVQISVEDEGEGIPADHIPRLTERFYQVNPSRSRSQGGTGLGLAIVKHIVERHRGRLRIDSRVGQGTNVHVLLPTA
jgi:two-component system, OmpR family, phosphate regulon sensor histidine kinase PhoR